MESGPAIFAGTVFALFGVALLTWTASCLRLRRPVAHGVHPVASATFTTLTGAIALVLAAWCFTHA
ncbi:hypothetical protein OK074_5164 [Actinobacteria bacterium OK074]|nr:hypothetical protein OK074_5164 [Actinobacteria bacterium OK074]